jgi:hypothetical protein
VPCIIHKRKDTARHFWPYYYVVYYEVYSNWERILNAHKKKKERTNNIMCLTLIAPPEVNDKYGEEEEAYKIVYKNCDNTYSPLNKVVFICSTINEGWSSKGLNETTLFDDIRYIAGVHAYATLEFARREFKHYTNFSTASLAIIKVRMNGKITVGYEDNDVVLVYENMVILEEIEAN